MEISLNPKLKRFGYTIKKEVNQMMQSIQSIKWFLFKLKNNCHLMYRGDDMYIMISKNSYDHSYSLYNHQNEEIIQLLDYKGNALFISENDFQYDDPVINDYKSTLKHLHPHYGFSVNEFNHNLASVTWTVQPDGRYFADEHGFGGSDEDEICIYAIINKSGKIVSKFSSKKPTNES